MYASTAAKSYILNYMLTAANFIIANFTLKVIYEEHGHIYTFSKSTKYV